MKQFVLTVMAMLCLPLFAQIDCYCDLEIEVEDTISQSSIVNVESPDSNEVFQAVDEMPEFPGGMEKLIQFIADSIHLPKCVTEGNVEGRSIVEFVVNKDGTLSDFKIAVPLHKECDVEAIRVLTLMPRWKPGKEDGELVRVRYAIPVRFRRP
ncbi:MAG: energy transducer TonB [Bacteroidaceae bacterium]|nr:energy transducer TonB [Bacteroidaceae bacterium]